MAVLISGGAGFLGLHLTRRLANQGIRVIIYDHSYDTAPPIFLDDTRIKCITGDIRDLSHLEETLQTYNVEVVVHLATLLTAVCEEDLLMAAKVNCEGTAAVFDASARCGVRRVVFGSSVAVFNDNPALPTGDDRPYGPSSVYGATKVFCEQLAHAFRRSHKGLGLLGLRFGWVYGFGRVRGWTEVQNVIEGFALEREIVPYPDYRQPSDWTYIDDAVGAILRCLDGPLPERIAINFSGEYRRIDEAIAHLKRCFPEVQVKPYAASLPPVGWNFRSDSMIRELGYSFQIGLEEGLERTVAAIRQAHDLPPLFDH
jgi:nucleoside-diphosphate-sugar epimerase